MADDQNIIDGYQLVNCVASGTHSQVWEILEMGGAQLLAMKLLLPSSTEDKEHVATLKHEAKVQSTLVHPSFVAFHKLVANKKFGYIVMDYFRSVNLKTQLMTDIVDIQSRIGKLIETLCLALGYMHDKGWVHRDIKPENILFNRSSELKLIDFSLSTRFASGISKLFAGKRKTIQGTRTYIAPETLLKQPPTPQTDMYSLAITLFELVTGQTPYTASNPDQLLRKHLKEIPPRPSEINANVTPEMDEFILRALAKKPADRYANMNEMLAMFRTLQVFKEDVLEIRSEAERKEREFLEAGGDLSDGLALSSRDDAMRDKTKAGSPARKKSKPKRKSKSKAKSKAKSKPAPQPVAAPQPIAPAQPVGMPQPVAMPQFAPPGYYPPVMAPPPPQQPMMPVAYMPQPGFPPQPGIPVAPGFAGQPQNAVPMPQPPVPAPGVPAAPPAQAQPAAGSQPAVQVSPEVPMQSRPLQSQPPAQPAAQPGETPKGSPQARQGGGDQILEKKVELQPQAPIAADRHSSQSDNDADLPLMVELPDID